MNNNAISETKKVNKPRINQIEGFGPPMKMNDNQDNNINSDNDKKVGQEENFFNVSFNKYFQIIFFFINRVYLIFILFLSNNLC